MRRSIFVALVAGLAISGCGGSHSGALPSVPAGQPAPPTGARGTASLSITIPKANAPATGTKRPSFVSPATTQMIVDVQQGGSSIAGYPQTVALTPTSNGCSSTLASTYCQLQIGLSPGSYTIGVTLEDAGNTVLSQTSNFPFTIVEGAANTISMTLGGVASSLVVVPLSAKRLKGGTSGLTAYGNYAQTFAVVPVDADGNFIVGPGAPTASATLEVGTNASLATPSPTSPQTFTLTPSYSAGDPTVAATDTIDVSATPVPDSGGSTISLSVPLAIYQPWIYVLTYDSTISTASITAFDESGNPVTGGYSGGVLSSTYRGYLGGITYGDGALYANVGYSNQNEVSSYPLTGNSPINDVGDGLSGVGNPTYAGPILFDTHNHWLYFGDSGVSSQVVALSADLSTVEATGSTGSYGQYGAVLNPANDQLVFASAIGSFVSCDEAIASCNSIGGPLFGNGLAYDPDANRIAANIFSGSNYIKLFDFNGTGYSAVALPAGSGGTALAYDPYAAMWLAGYNGSGCTGPTYCGIAAYNESVTGPATNAPDFSGTLANTAQIKGIVVVP